MRNLNPFLVAVGLLGNFSGSTLLGQDPGNIPWDCGMAVVTCFSGVFPNTGNVNLSGPVMGLIDVRNRSTAPVGTWWQAASTPPLKYMHPSWTANTMGQVFGLAIDMNGDIFVTPTTVYYCTTSNQPSPFGPAGPGGIYRVSGTTGAVSTYVSTGPFTPGGNSIPNKGSGLGNICYDPAHNQFFVTNFADGMIYRVKNGQVLSRFDPFATTNPAQVPTAFVPLGERTWGVGYHNGRVYFARWQEDIGRPSSASNEIWSIGLNPTTGEFSAATFNSTTQAYEDGEKLEITLPCFQGNWSNPVSDIAFAADGRMLVAERTMSSDCGGALTNNFFGYAHSSRVLEYTPVGNTWTLTPGHASSLCPTTSANDLKFSVGRTTFNGANSAGGVDYGYESFSLEPKDFHCDKYVWATGDQLHQPTQTPHPSCPSSVNGDTWVYGMQGMPASGGNNFTGVLVDFDNNVCDHDKIQLGDVEIRRCPCPKRDTLCDLLDINLIPSRGTPPSCCWQLNLNMGINAFALEAQILTPGVVFSSILFDPFFNSSSTGNSFWLSKFPKIGIPAGTYPNAVTFCLGNITSPGQVPQVIVFNWYQLGPADIPEIFCSDTIELYCDLSPVPPPPCAVAVKNVVECNPNNPSQYVHSVVVQNAGNFCATQFVLSSPSPPGTFGFLPWPFAVGPVSSSITSSPATPCVPPGGMFPVNNFTIVPAAPVTAPTPVCFNITLVGQDSCCTSGPHCVTLMPCCDPCQRRRVVAQQAPQGKCCHTLDITQGCPFPYFSKLELAILTPGVVFGSHATGPAYVGSWVNPLSTPTVVQWQYIGGAVPPGNYPGLINFCLSNIQNPSQVPQVLVLRWLVPSSKGVDSVACTDTLRFQCPPPVNEDCLKLLKSTISCKKEGGALYYDLQLVVQNTSTPPHPATHVLLTQISGPAATISSNPAPLVPSPLPPSGTGTVNVGLYGPIPVGSKLCFTLRLMDMSSGDNWCCTEPDTFCVTIPPCCCDSTIGPILANAVNTTVQGCKVTLKIDSIPCNGYVDYIHWGDGSQSYGPFPPGSMPMHTYSNSGTYVISYLFIILNNSGAICLEMFLQDTVQVNCPERCRCVGFSNLYISWPKKGVKPLKCDTSHYEFVPCPPPGANYQIGGVLTCQGDSCPTSPLVNWQWVRQIPGPPTVVQSGTAVANPSFSISILPAWYTTPGHYELQLFGLCGNDTCRCVLRLAIECPDPCPCVPKSLGAAVNQGFAVSAGSLFNCKRCFSPVGSLGACDKVEWFLQTPTGQTLLGTTTGNQPFCHTFPAPGGVFTVVMKVTRFKSDGSICAVFEKKQLVKVKCPVIDIIDCSFPVWPNPTFSQNAVPGTLGGGGSTTGWARRLGSPRLVGNVPTSADGWAILLEGGETEDDAVQADRPICVVRDSGALSLRIKPTDWHEGTEMVVAFEEKHFSDPPEAHVLKFTLPQEAMGEWLEVEVPYNLRNLKQLDSCGGSTANAKIKPVIGICVPTHLLDKRPAVLVDLFCMNGQVVSAHEPSAAGDMRVFPVPTTGLLRLLLPEDEAAGRVRWRVVDNLGRILLEGELTSPSIDVSALPAGFYRVEVESATQRRSKPIVKE